MCLKSLPLFFLLLGSVDAECLYEDAAGPWLFELGPSWKGSWGQTCSSNSTFEVINQYRVMLKIPNIAYDQYDNRGNWTLVCGQGLEVVIGGRKYYGQFENYLNGTERRMYCDTLNPGYSHDVLGRTWNCFKGYWDTLYQNPDIQHMHVVPEEDFFGEDSYPKPNSEELIEDINKANITWTAKMYEKFKNITSEDLLNRAGERKSRISRFPEVAATTNNLETFWKTSPSHFDWRDVRGINFVSPVRDQMDCGGCYAYSAIAMAESRLRVVTKNTQQRIFSPRDIIDCSIYSNGCHGGVPFTSAGKYAEDFGLVEEDCKPETYEKDGKCDTNPNCTRYYMTDYKYIGDFYGNCNDLAMMEAIFNRGPIIASLRITWEFYYYKNGIFIPRFEECALYGTIHAVLIVGWGETDDGTLYWIAKNSWGSDWGMDGYFQIRRGNNDCGIESMALEATPVLMFG